jgi:TonB family protein
MRTTVRRIALLIATLAVGVVDAQDRQRSLEQQAKSQVGTIATMCGTVVEYTCEPPERTSFLYLKTPLSAGGVSVAIAHEDRAKFGLRFELRHVLMNVCATGQVEKRGKGYRIVVRDPGQLRVSNDPPSSGNFGGDSFSKCDDGVELPTVVREVKPQYTEAAMRARLEGMVVLEAVVLTSGQVGDIRTRRSLDSRLGLDDQAIQALKSWRFKPGTYEGRPVPVVVTVALTFHLK